jgi:hypothetical protein
MRDQTHRHLFCCATYAFDLIPTEEECASATPFRYAFELEMDASPPSEGGTPSQRLWRVSSAPAVCSSVDGTLPADALARICKIVDPNPLRAAHIDALCGRSPSPRSVAHALGECRRMRDASERVPILSEVSAVHGVMSREEAVALLVGEGVPPTRSGVALLRVGSRGLVCTVRLPAATAISAATARADVIGRYFFAHVSLEGLSEEEVMRHLAAECISRVVFTTGDVLPKEMVAIICEAAKQMPSPFRERWQWDHGRERTHLDASRQPAERWIKKK